MDEIPEFAEAERRLLGFLKREGHGALELRWVFREDLRPGRGGDVVVRWPLPASNRALSEQEVDAGRELGYGVMVEALGRHGQRVFAFVGYPRSGQEAQAGLISGFKLSIALPLRVARLETGWRWALRRWWVGPGADRLPDDRVPARAGSAVAAG